MGILPELVSNIQSSETIIDTSTDKVYGKRTYKFDFDKKDFVTDILGNVVETSNPEDVLKQSVDKILHDTRFKFLSYPDDYGNEIQLVLEQDEPFEVVKCELKRVYEEALSYHPLIKSVTDFTAEDNGENIVCTFFVVGINGGSIYREEVINQWKAV